MPEPTIAPSPAAIAEFLRRNFANLPEVVEPMDAHAENRPIRPTATHGFERTLHQEISSYPPEIQRIILESDLIIRGFSGADYVANRRAHGISDTTAGYYLRTVDEGTTSPNGASLRHLSNSINVPIDGTLGNATLPIVRHEMLHGLDEAIQRLRGGAGFLSDTSASWQAAVAREMEIYQQEVTHGTQVPPDPNQPEYARQPLHESEIRPLGDHLARYQPEQRGREAFAEMLRHYTSVLAENGGNHAVADRLLSERYSAAWPVFRDELLPQIQQTAATIAERRNWVIEAAIETKAEVEEIYGRKFTPEQRAAFAAELETKSTAEIKYEERNLNNAVEAFQTRPDIRRPNIVSEDGIVQQYVEAARLRDLAAHENLTAEALQAKALAITKTDVPSLQHHIDEANAIIAKEGRVALYERIPEVRAEAWNTYNQRLKAGTLVQFDPDATIRYNPSEAELAETPQQHLAEELIILKWRQHLLILRLHPLPPKRLMPAHPPKLLRPSLEWRQRCLHKRSMLPKLTQPTLLQQNLKHSISPPGGSAADSALGWRLTAFISS